LFPGSSVIVAFKNELKGSSVSKGTIRFPTDKPLPAALVKKLVKARLAENEGKKRRMEPALRHPGFLRIPATRRISCKSS
jgi:uncharacterized protein YdhG (YjbR/CyaY superfamily)